MKIVVCDVARQIGRITEGGLNNAADYSFEYMNATLGFPGTLPADGPSLRAVVLYDRQPGESRAQTTVPRWRLEKS